MMKTPRRPRFQPAGLLLLLLSVAAMAGVARAQQQVEADEQPVAVEANLISVTVAVTDARGRSLSALDRGAFTVYDDQRRQDIAFFTADDGPASVVLLFDLSGSITPGRMGQARESLRRFVEYSHPRDEFLLMGFEEGAGVIAGPTSDVEALLGGLTLLKGGGRTALYDACGRALERLRHGAHRRRAILVISDGEDNYSRSTVGDLRRELKEEDVLVYSIGLGDRAEGASVAERRGRNTLEELSELTGGRAFFPRTPAELLGACEQVALELRSQYQIAYRPSPFAPDGKWRRIRVRVEPQAGGERLFVRHREGYYARARRASHPGE